MKNFNITMVIFLLAACAQSSNSLRTEYNETKPSQPPPVTGADINWTGFVIKVENTVRIKSGHEEQQGCLTVLAKSIDELASDLFKSQLNENRFIACKSEFLQPELFMKKSVRIAGQIKSTLNNTNGEGDHTYPLVTVQIINIL